MAVELVKIVSKNFDIPDSHKLEVALKMEDMSQLTKHSLWNQMRLQKKFVNQD